MSRLNPDGEKTKGRKKKVNISIKLLNEFNFDCIIKNLVFISSFFDFAVELDVKVIAKHEYLDIFKFHF